MASGDAWQSWIDKAVACPPEWAFGTKLVVNGREWICMDRGSKIVYGEDHIPWIDMLTEDALVPHGTLVKAEVVGK